MSPSVHNGINKYYMRNNVLHDITFICEIWSDVKMRIQMQNLYHFIIKVYTNVVLYKI